MSNPNVSFCLTLHRLYGKLRMQLDEELGTYHGIDFDDFALLQSLAGAVEGPPSLVILATELGMWRSALLRRLRPLEKIGLIACLGNVTERRVVLRPAGLSIMETAQDTVNGTCGKLSSIENVEKLNEALVQSELARRSTI